MNREALLLPVDRKKVARGSASFRHGQLWPERLVPHREGFQRDVEFVCLLSSRLRPQSGFQTILQTSFRRALRRIFVQTEEPRTEQVFKDIPST